MNSIEQQLIQLNDISLEIVNELGKEESSVEYINRQMDLRERYINELEKLSEKRVIAQDSESNQDSIKALFDTFANLSENIRESLHETLYNNQEKLKDATRHREAEDRYQILKTPDISYF